MRLIAPIKDIRSEYSMSPSPIYISQKWGNVWIADRDMVINGVSIKKGDNVYLKAFGMQGHNGVDIAAPRYTPIYAAHSGYIVEASASTSYGTKVALYFESDGKEYLLLHGHLDNYKPLPKIPWDIKYRGKYVAQGEKIGEVDSTGFSTGDHLHWGLYEYKNGIKLNTNNGYEGSIDPWQFVKEHYMEIFQIVGEKTLVVKNMDGKYYIVATDVELYPYVAKTLGLEGKNFTPIEKSEVMANTGGTLEAGLTFISK
jgi:murein DD-endopeptidase MepM/ murein hydrolase activator NlpD